MDFQMTQKDARAIVGWFSTGVGQNFLEYLRVLGEGNTSDLMTATEIDMYRAQGRSHQLRRVLDFLTHAERVVSGEIPASEEDEGSDMEVSDLSDLRSSSVDDGPVEGSD